MKASEIKNMAMIRDALAGVPASGASSSNEIVFNGGEAGVLGYDCGIPEEFASDVSGDGKRVLIGDMNRILQLVGTGLYLRQRGASNEFDERVVAIDKGNKGDGEHWGYPNGAIIDWWDGNTFQKVICIKSGTGEDNGNCTVGPDDAVHGVNGSGTKYWQLIERPSQQSFIGYTSGTILEVAHADGSGGYIFDKFAKIFLSWDIKITHRDIASYTTSQCRIIMYLKPGDIMRVSGSSVSINGNMFSPSTSSVSTNGTAIGISLDMSINKCQWQ